MGMGVGSRRRMALLLAGAAVTGAMGQGSVAFAQTAPTASTASSSQDGSQLGNTAAEPDNEASKTDIVVTGSRIVRDGSTAPTPVTVLGSEFIAQRGQNNIADSLNELPSFRASQSPASTAGRVVNAGANFADLRSLGGNRTLTLVDGKRFVPSATTGQVDLNIIPAIMLQRVEVVTGGASATYGSDAVAGVVNLILKKHVVGVEGDFQYGQSEIGDNVGYRGALLAGQSFFDDRLHVQIAGEYFRNKGARDPYSRDWGRRDYGIVVNPNPGTNGYPLRVIAPNVHSATMAPGGLITSGPLRGTQFLNDGTPAPFTYGDLAGSQLMLGGSGGGEGNGFFTGFRLLPKIERALVYGRVDYQVSDALTVFADASYSDVDVHSQSAIPFNYGNLTIQADNAYLPQSVRDRMTQAGVTSFGFGRFNTDIGPGQNTTSYRTRRIVTGVEADLGGSWKADASYEYGRTNYDFAFNRARRPALFALSIDAVRDPGTGRIVCRSTLTNPANGCIPYNPFGVGQGDPAAFAYFLGTQSVTQFTEQHSAAANVQGSLFALPGGNLSVALGGEYRKERAVSEVDAVSAASLWDYGNPKSLRGSYDVKEVYGELSAPLLRDVAFARSLELTAAARYTDYSTSGGVTTWKLGGDWEPVDGIRLRVTRSRDIRAANISELFTPAVSSPFAIRDPSNSSSYFILLNTAGNPNLRPEKANTFTGGVVLSPTSRLRLSADYFSIGIDGAISSLAAQDIIDRCFRGETTLCQQVKRNAAGTITTVDNLSINIAKLKTRGLDLEASYRLPLSDFSSLPGELNFRVFATKVFEYTTNDGVVKLDLLGQTSGRNTDPTVPNWNVNGSIGYSDDILSLLAQGRFISAGRYDNRYVEGRDINNNHTPSRFYLNLSASVRLLGDGKRKLELYGVVNNALDQDPPIVPNAASGATNFTYYDVIGRSFIGGIRFRY